MLYSTLRNTLQLNRGLGQENMAYMMSSLSEMILKWPCFFQARVNMSFLNDTTYLSVCFCCQDGWAVPSRLKYRLKATTARKVLQFQGTSPHEASSRNKMSACLKEGLITTVWFIPTKFLFWFKVLPSCYIHLISKTVLSRVQNDFGCEKNIALETKFFL